MCGGRGGGLLEGGNPGDGEEGEGARAGHPGPGGPADTEAGAGGQGWRGGGQAGRSQPLWCYFKVRNIYVSNDLD